MSPRTANRPSLSQEQIVTAALELIDETGLDGHNMRALAGRLGVDASTIYYHVPSKSALFSLIVDRVMSGLDPTTDDPTLGSADRLVAAAHTFRRALMAHPRALPLVAARSLRTPAQLVGVEAILGILYDAGFSAAEAMVALDAVGQTVIGMTSIHAAHLEAEATEPEQPWGDLPPDRFPNVHRMLTDGAYLGFDAEFEITVRSLVAGLLAAHASGGLIPPGIQPMPLPQA
jgi:AcrR family transcriptional regulator